MQCKDIPELPVLTFMRELNEPCTWFWTPDFRPESSVLNAMPEGTPEKLGLAKMRALIRRGFVDGCGCGCRGNFVLTPKGLAHINAGGANG